MSKLKRGCLAVGLLCLIASVSAQAVITIKITKGDVGAQPIAVVPFGGQGGSTGLPVDIATIVADDLARTGLYAPLPFADLPGRPFTAEQVNFGDWRLLRAGHLVIGNIVPQGGGNFAVEFRLFDVLRAKQLKGFSIPANGSNARRVAHQIADIVYEELTDVRGAFDTRIAYVTEDRTREGKRMYSLTIADSDGFNAHTILESDQPVMSPTWSPDGQRLAYVSFESGRPRIYSQNLATGARDQLSSFPGLNGAPAFSPDGRKVAMTLSKDGNPEIYVLDLASKRLLRLTNNGAIDTEPAWAPDGASLVFTSDRGGKPQIYRMPVTGGRAERVTFDGTYNARATFSPDGTRLALVHGAGGKFQIGLLDLVNGALTVLTETGLDESPSFAPNGSMILYATTDRSGPTLAAVSTDGQTRQRIASSQGSVREPSWSPFRAAP